MHGLIGLGLMLLSVLPVSEPTLKRFEYTETHMGSPFHLVLYTGDEGTASRAAKAAFVRIAALDLALSDYNPESELMRLCEKAGGPPVPVSADLYDALDGSLKMAKASGGAFDPTVAPVVRLWRRARRDRKLPDPDTLAKALSLVDHSKLVLDPTNKTAQLTDRGMKLDLGGIAKGLASQAAIDALKKLGVDRALVAGAGDIVVSGPPPRSDGWIIAVTPLGPEETTNPLRLSLVNCSISTSGDAEQFVEIAGKRYGHIVDPKTGLGVVERAGVTIVANNGAIADSLATAAFVLGTEKGLELVEKTPGASAIFARKIGDRLEVKRTAKFDQLRKASGTTSDATLGPG